MLHGHAHLHAHLPLSSRCRALGACSNLRYHERVRVRRASWSDVEALARTERRSWQHAYREILSQRWLAALDEDALQLGWSRRLRGGQEQVRVVEVGRELGGFVTFGRHGDATWRGRAGEVWMLYVAPEQQGRGIGRALLEHALRELEDTGFLWLVVRVLADNARARGFYEHMGLRLDGHRERARVGEGVHGVVRYARSVRPVFAWPRP